MCDVFTLVPTGCFLSFDVPSKPNVLYIYRRRMIWSKKSHVSQRILSFEDRVGNSGTLMPRRSGRDPCHPGCVGGVVATFATIATSLSRDWKGWLPRCSFSAPRYRRRQPCQSRVLDGSLQGEPLQPETARMVRPPSTRFARALLVAPPGGEPVPQPMP